MPSRTPDTQPPAHAPSFWRVSRRTWMWIGAAIIVGLLLFVLLLSTRRDNDFFRVAPTAGPKAGEYEPLPVPLPADETQDSGNTPPSAETAEPEVPRIIETAPVPAVSTRPQAAPPPAAGPSASNTAPVPLPGQTPAPRYPAQALRRGLGGKVRVRAEVGPDGAPLSVSVLESSGNRELDRAALDAVRRWRFQPARIDGQPSNGMVVIPIEFTPGE